MLAATFFIFVALASPPAGSAQSPMKTKCMPSNDTMHLCFKPLKDNFTGASRDIVVTGLASDTMSNYVSVANTTSFDTEGFTFDQMERNPLYMCSNMDDFVAAIRCVEEATKQVCPLMPSENFAISDRMADALAYMCSQISTVNETCSRASVHYHKKCQNLVRGQMKQAPGFTTENPMHNGNADSMDSEHSFDWSGMGHGPKMNGTDDEWVDTWKEEEEKTERTKQCFMKSASDSMEETAMWSNMMCFHGYKILKCVKTPLEQCHAHTADVMMTFMKKMMPPDCVTQMDQCEALTCDSPTCGAGKFVLSWATALFSAMVMIKLF